MTQGSESKLQSARILGALEAARSAANRVTQAQRDAIASVRTQRSELDAAQESGQRLSTRGRDIRNSLNLLRESVERAKLTALNAGLEGARLGDPVGKALVVMGDEVRQLLARGLDALEEHASLLTELDRERERHLTELAVLGEGVLRTSKTLTRAEEQGQLGAALLNELQQDLTQAFGTDTESARVLAEASTHVSSAASSLQELARRGPLGARELRELLGPLLALLPAPEDGEA